MNNRNQQQPARKEKLKPVSAGWNRTLKTWLAHSTGPQAAVYRNALRQDKIGLFPEHLGMAQLSQALRGAPQWWAKGR